MRSLAQRTALAVAGWVERQIDAYPRDDFVVTSRSYGDADPLPSQADRVRGAAVHAGAGAGVPRPLVSGRGTACRLRAPGGRRAVL